MGQYRALNVKDFGAVADDSTDDAAAIQACFDECQTLSDSLGIPVPVVVPPGKYYISTTLDLPQQNGENAKLLPLFELSGYGARIRIGADEPIFQASGATYSSWWVPPIKGFGFKGDHDYVSNVRTNQVGIDYNDSYGMRIEDCTFDDLSHGIKLTNCIAARIADPRS
jgi:hypothetical protein